jgi:hypothetical protein
MGKNGFHKSGKLQTLLIDGKQAATSLLGRKKQ